MPLYEYLCKACGHAFEQLRSIATMDERRPCPQCAAVETERQLTQRFAFTGGSDPDEFKPSWTNLPNDDPTIGPTDDPMTTEEWYHDP